MFLIEGLVWEEGFDMKCLMQGESHNRVLLEPGYIIIVYLIHAHTALSKKEIFHLFLKYS